MSHRIVKLLAPVLALLALPLLAACGGQSEAERGPVVLAASSLQEALQEAAAAWAKQGHPAPVLSFAATSALARQIEQGAPADLFISADEEWADTLERQNLLRAGSRRDLVTNRLVLVTGKGGKARRLEDLGEGKLALADPASVPAGKYAKAALEKLGRWSAVERQVVPAENVRAALALVERGEASLGVVYTTDARASAKVEILETFPESSHPPIRYSLGIVPSSKHPDADGLATFLSSAEAAGIFQRHGFGLVR
jgi:molybdate transport system substrate-binding protein